MSEGTNNNQQTQETAQPQPQPASQQPSTEPVSLPKPNNTETFTKGAKPKE